jgi:hypothetical protein
VWFGTCNSNPGDIQDGQAKVGHWVQISSSDKWSDAITLIINDQTIVTIPAYVLPVTEDCNQTIKCLTVAYGLRVFPTC